MPAVRAGPRRFAACLVLCACLHPNPAIARESSPAGPFLGRPVFEVIEAFRDQGYPFAYSTNLVPDTLLVKAEPVSKDPIGIIREILGSHGLALKQADGIYLVIRGARGPPPENTGSLLVIVRNPESKLLKVPVAISGSPGLRAVDQLGPGIWQFRPIRAGRYELEISAAGFAPVRRAAVVSPGEVTSLHIKMEAAPIELEALTVSTSRYVLFSNSQFFVDQRAIENLPGNGDDPLRSMHRLPGAAAGGWSAMTHFRGGEENESAIFLNGLKLIDPFHVRDFHNVFSSIDARSISGVEAYTGGFPVIYGDRMSGILLLQSRKPEKPRRHELGFSVFNTSLLTSGYNASGGIDWLLSARRSNLDLVLDKQEHGVPNYDDVFGTLGFNYSPDTRLTFNVLRASDRILVITEHLPEEREQSISDTLNKHFWVQLEKDWAPDLGMSAVISASSYSNSRDAVAHDPEQLVGAVQDDREVDVQGLRVDFTRYAGNRHLLKWGLEARKESARYHYQSQAEYSGFYLAYPGVPESIERDISLAPKGESYAAYFSDRWQVTPQIAIDAGLRWDKQTFIGPVDDEQLSPRMNLLYTLNPRIDLRLTVGRYYQSQDVQQIQVEDGVEHFFPAQQADHLITGMTVRLNDAWSLRAEAFVKQYSKLRPRFENLLDPVPLIAELEPDRVRIAPSSGRARGFELTVEYDDGDTLNGWTSYTLSRVTDRIDGVDQLRNWDQRHSLQAGLAWHRKQWEIGLAIKIHSGWPTTPAFLVVDEQGGDDEGEDEEEETGLSLVYGPRNSDRLNTFANVDFRVSRKWPLKKGRITAFFELSNALNRKNECCVDYDFEEEDQTEEFPVLERSVDDWLGIAPAIGVLWEF